MTAEFNEPEDQLVTIDRRRQERRGTEPAEVEEQKGQRKGQRRRHIDPTTCERDYNGEEIEFMQALDAYKRANGRMFPTCSEVLEVIRGLGYVRLSGDQRLLMTGQSGPAPLGGSQPL